MINGRITHRINLKDDTIFEFDLDAGWDIKDVLTERDDATDEIKRIDIVLEKIGGRKHEKS